MFVIARDVGQVRDVLRRTGPGATPVRTYPTVRAAVDAVTTGDAAIPAPHGS